MNYKRTIIGENIGFSSIIDEKFTTCTVHVRFITELTADMAAKNTVAVGMMSASNSKLKTLAELNERLSECYGAALSTFSRKRGDLHVLGLTSSWICDRFALDNESITEAMLEVIRDCIFAPNAENGVFDAESFKITKKDLLDKIDAELNEKRSYALARAGEVAYRGEPAENSCTGSRESAEAVTSEEAYEAYLKLMENAQVEISYIAPEENKAVEDIFRSEFAKFKRVNNKYEFKKMSPVKAEVENVSEEMDVRQSKIVLCFKSDCQDTAALKMFDVIWGETPVSKLFMNVREKLSLCYYCACRLNTAKNTLMVDCGVEKGNIQKAYDEILHQLDEMCKGNFDDAEFESALLTLENVHVAVGDTPSSYSNWYFEQFCNGTEMTPEEKFAEYRAVTRERIIAAAKSVKLDSTYYMLNKETAE